MCHLSVPWALFNGTFSSLATLQGGATVALVLNASASNSWSVVSAVASGTMLLSCNQAGSSVPLSVYAIMNPRGSLVWATQANISSVSKVRGLPLFFAVHPCHEIRMCVLMASPMPLPLREHPHFWGGGCTGFMHIFV